MNTLGNSADLIQHCCYDHLSQELGHASEALKKENIDSNSITIKANNKAISTLKNQYQDEAQVLGKSLDKVCVAVKTFVQGTGTGDIASDLNELEQKIFLSFVKELDNGGPDDKERFNKDFESFVNSYNKDVLKKTTTPERITEKLDLDISLYKKGLQRLADKDQEDSRSGRFHEGGDLRYRFDSRIDRLTTGIDRLPHFKKELSLKEKENLQEFLKDFGEDLTEDQTKTLTQAFLDFSQIRDDTVRFSGELFTLPRGGVREFREMTVPEEKLRKVTLLSPENRARELEHILAIGELFSNTAFPLINVLSLTADRMLKQEILTHLMLDRGVSDENFKPLEEAVHTRILELDSNLLKEVENKRNIVELNVKGDLIDKPFASVDELEKYCRSMLGLGAGKEELDQVLLGLDREKFVENFKSGGQPVRATLRNAFAMRLADSAARKLVEVRVNDLTNSDAIHQIENMPRLVPQVPIKERRVFTVNGGAASGKSTTVRSMLGDPGKNKQGLPDRRDIVTITRDSLMTSLLDPDSLHVSDKDYYAAYAFDEAVLIANNVERIRTEREKITGEGPHLFYDQVPPDVRKYAIGINSGGMDGVVVNMPVETSVLLAQLRGEKEKRYAGRHNVLISHKSQVESQRKVNEFISSAQEQMPVHHVSSRIDTNVSKDLPPFPTVNFDYKNKTMEVKSAGYFFDFLRKQSINMNAETLGDLYVEMSDGDYVKAFMEYAKSFDRVTLNLLTEYLLEHLVAFSKEAYPQLEGILKEGEFSATAQRERQSQIKSLSNAGEFIKKATEALEKKENKSAELSLAQAEAQITEYLEEHGHKQDITSKAAANIAVKLRDVIEDLRASFQ